MTTDDQVHWDARYQGRAGDREAAPKPPSAFLECLELFPASGLALEVACGTGETAVWLAQRGLQVHAYDISPVAIDQARLLAASANVVAQCHFEVADLDHGLPAGGQVDLLLCTMFRDVRLDGAMVKRLQPGGVLALACLSEVDATSGRFRIKRGELLAAFGAFEQLEIVKHQEADGVARLVALKRE